MVETRYPRFGCAFCDVTRHNKAQIMSHLDEYIPEVAERKLGVARLSGTHFIPLLRAVRRRSGRHGINSSLQLKASPFDTCRNWCLFVKINNPKELAEHHNRVQRTAAEWQSVARNFIDSPGAKDLALDRKELEDSVHPDWTAVDKAPVNNHGDRDYDSSDSEDDSEDSEDSDDEDIRPASRRAKVPNPRTGSKVSSAISGATKAGSSSYRHPTNTAASSSSRAPAKSYAQGGMVDARVQSGFDSPVKSKNGRFTVINDGHGSTRNMRQGDDHAGSSRTKRRAATVSPTPRLSASLFGKGKKRARFVVPEPEEPEELVRPVRKSKSTNFKAGAKVCTPLDMVCRAPTDTAPQTPVEIIDLESAPRKPDPITPPRKSAATEGFDIWTPEPAKCMTLFVECFGERGIFEIAASCTLPEAIEIVETRIGDISIDCFVVKGVGKLTAKMWAERTGGGMVVSADWMWVGE